MYTVIEDRKIKLHELDQDFIIPTKKAELSSHVTSEIEVGTNDCKGGNSTKGSRTVLRFTTDGFMKAKVLDRYGFGEDTIELVLGGDDELYNFIEALKIALVTLKEGVVKGKD